MVQIEEIHDEDDNLHMDDGGEETTQRLLKAPLGSVVVDEPLELGLNDDDLELDPVSFSPNSIFGSTTNEDDGFTEEELLDVLQGTLMEEDLLLMATESQDLPELEFDEEEPISLEDMTFNENMFEGDEDVDINENMFEEEDEILMDDGEEKEEAQNPSLEIAALEEALQALNLDFPPEKEPLEIPLSNDEVPICQPCTGASAPPPMFLDPSLLNTQGKFVNVAAATNQGIPGLEELLESLMQKPDGTYMSPQELETMLEQMELGDESELPTLEEAMALTGQPEQVLVPVAEEEEEEKEEEEEDEEESTTKPNPEQPAREITETAPTNEETTLTSEVTSQKAAGEDKEEAETDNTKAKATEAMRSLFQQSARKNTVSDSTKEEASEKTSAEAAIGEEQKESETDNTHSAAEALHSLFGEEARLAKERLCVGHSDTIFAVALSECGTYLATASKDGTVRIWNIVDNSELAVLEGHKSGVACLRVAWASSNWAEDTLRRTEGGPHKTLLTGAYADGTVNIWTLKDDSSSWTPCATIDPASFKDGLIPPVTPGKTPKVNKKPVTIAQLMGLSNANVCMPVSKEAEEEKPETCAVQWVDNWKGLPTGEKKQNSFLLTSSDDFVHIWEAEPNEGTTELNFTEVMSLHFGCFHNNFGFGVSTCRVTDDGKENTIGGLEKPTLEDRNTETMQFVFEMSYCAANGLLGVSLSDGSLRLMNGRGVCIFVIQIPQSQMSQISAFAWNSEGTKVVTCLAMGHVIAWNVQTDGSMSPLPSSLSVKCTAVLEGGHDLGKPLFGARFFGKGESLLLTWGVDGRLCAWNAFSIGNVNAPLATLREDAGYPVFSVDLGKSCLAIGGGDKDIKGAPSVKLCDYGEQS